MKPQSFLVYVKIVDFFEKRWICICERFFWLEILLTLNDQILLINKVTTVYVCLSKVTVCDGDLNKKGVGNSCASDG